MEGGQADWPGGRCCGMGKAEGSRLRGQMVGRGRQHRTWSGRSSHLHCLPLVSTPPAPAAFPTSHLGGGQGDGTNLRPPYNIWILEKENYFLCLESNYCRTILNSELSWFWVSTAVPVVLPNICKAL